MTYHTEVDELGSINKAIAELEATASKLKARIKAKGLGVHQGERFVAEVLEYDRPQLSTKMIREMVEDDVISACTQIQHISSVTVKEAAHG